MARLTLLLAWSFGARLLAWTVWRRSVLWYRTGPRERAVNRVPLLGSGASSEQDSASICALIERTEADDV
jgi:hypothetical protein